jgi:hypothetical protein
MAIIATNNSTPREPIPAGNYPARCYQMIHIGTIMELINGEQKLLNKVRIGWELPTELKVFKEENGEQPLVISEEYTLSMNEKSNLRKMLASWRGKDFSEDEAKAFDITKLLGVQCMINVIHRASKKDATRVYEKIGSVSSVPKGMNVPAQINPTMVLSYDDFSWETYEKLPEFIKDKMKQSVEFAAMQQPNAINSNSHSVMEPVDDLPF